MARDSINLLPRERIKALHNGYFFRLATVAIVLLALLVFAHGLFLLPSYMLVSNEVSNREAELAALANTQGASEEQAAGERIASLTADAAHLVQLSHTASASAAIRAVLGADRTGISIVSMTFSPPQAAGASGKMVLIGTATTRETLRSFQGALSSLPFVNNVDLPISAFAKDKELPFTISLTGTLTP